GPVAPGRPVPAAAGGGCCASARSLDAPVVQFRVGFPAPIALLTTQGPFKGAMSMSTSNHRLYLEVLESLVTPAVHAWALAGFLSAVDALLHPSPSGGAPPPGGLGDPPTDPEC